MFKNKIILIVGGTGSFGSAATKYFLDNSEVSEIRILSRDEKKQDDMRKQFNNEKIKFYLGDVRDISTLWAPMYQTNFVFQAAALKQVPSCEFFPLEAVKTNVIGTDNVLTTAIDSKVEKVVCLSTDKAAYPINAMGISKALMEKIAIAKSKVAKNTVITCTRYGNVLCSRGSVVPLFVSQIFQNTPLTVTNPNMTRFLMSLRQAIDLIVFAFNHGEPGDLFIQKAPASTIGDLAQALLLIFNSQVPIKTIGMRHGEKLFETLATSEEMFHAIDMENYFRIPLDKRSLNYDKYINYGSKKLIYTNSYSSNNTYIMNIEEIKHALLSLTYVKHKIRMINSVKY
ncbi:MAG: polysaccharide biosynthesis protein [Clostridiales Family XIII bacterium]|jgi:UDP-glucose 4-epimerase|nr:polysaccharide biosynthesis protein [Clostridiales Family XIII bacterium]